VEKNNYFYIKNVDTGYYLSSQQHTDYSIVWTVPWSQTNLGSQWSLEPLGGASFQIVNRGTSNLLRPSSAVGEDYASVQIVPPSQASVWTTWQFKSVSPNTAIGDTAYAGGGGTVAGALPHSCKTPEGFTRVYTLEEMIDAMHQSSVKVALSPGNYYIDEDDGDLFTSDVLANNIAGSTLFAVDGNNSVYDFRCVLLQFDTSLLSAFDDLWVSELHITGNNNVIRHFTIEDIGERAPLDSALSILMDGRDNLVEGAVLTSRGSAPYGLGDAYGSGGALRPLGKHSVVLLRGSDNKLRQSTVFNHAYAHSVSLQGAKNVSVDGVYIQSALRSTTDMLAANDSRFAQADELAANRDFQTAWGYRLPAGYWMSLSEDGVRADGSGYTLIDGTQYLRETANVSLLNSVVINARNAVAISAGTGIKIVENTTLIGNETGFSIGAGSIFDSYADADVGPVLTFHDSTDVGTNADLTILPTTAAMNGWSALAYIAGSNHTITLRDGGGSVAQDLQIVLSGDKHSVRHLAGSLRNDDHLSLADSDINNLTDYPLLLQGLAEGVTGRSNGPVSGNTSANSIE